jgi:hypothetical protein
LLLPHPLSKTNEDVWIYVKNQIHAWFGSGKEDQWLGDKDAKKACSIGRMGQIHRRSWR